MRREPMTAGELVRELLCDEFLSDDDKQDSDAIPNNAPLLAEFFSECEEAALAQGKTRGQGRQLARRLLRDAVGPDSARRARLIQAIRDIEEFWTAIRRDRIWLAQQELQDARALRVGRRR